MWRKVLRRRLAKRRRGALTIMAIPTIDGSVKSISFPLLLVYTGSALAVAIVAFLVLSYFGMTATLARFYRDRLVKDAYIQQLTKENEALESSNEANKKRIEEFAAAAAQLQRELTRLDGASKEIMGIIKGKKVSTTGASIASRGTYERGTAPGLSREESATADLVPDTGNASLADETEAQLDRLTRDAAGLLSDFSSLRRSAVSYRDRLDHTPTAWPARGRITSSFGSRRHPLTRRVQSHEGIDIAGAVGTPIRATADGVVRFSGTRVGYGRAVVIDHGYGFETVYGHNIRNAVKAGQRVRRGQIVAYLGNTGTSTGPHVHYEVRVSGRPVNPRLYME